MQDGRFSTIRFNEWICVTAQYEKAVARIGRQVYQAFSRGLVTDFTSLEMCREVSETFAEAREIRADLEEELERDALDGLNVEESKVADEHRQLTQAQVTKRKVKLKMTRFMGRQSINRSLAAHRDRVKNLSRDLGLRALAVHQDEPVLKVRGHRALCQLAERLNDDADKKWQDIVAVNNAGGGGLSFHTILINFVANFASFSKGTALGKFLLRFFKYDEQEEKDKLSKQYEGSTTAEALQAQMEEIEEPHLDVGREIDNMQQEYEETPIEWNLPATGDASEVDFPAPASDLEAEPVAAPVEKWEPEADTWNPDAEIDDDFLNVVADAPDFSNSPNADIQAAPEPAPPPAGPTLLRRRPEPEAESWSDTSASEPPPAAQLPQVGMSAPSQTDSGSAGDDWSWGETEADSDDWAQATPSEDPFAVTSPAASAPAATSDPDPFAQYQTEPEAPPAPKTAPAPAASHHPPSSGWGNQDAFGQGQDTGNEEAFERQRPPFQRQSAPIEAQAPSPPPHAAVESTPPFVKAKPKETPLGDWNPEDSFGGTGAPSAPSTKAPAPETKDGWGTNNDEDYGWGTPAADAPRDKPEPTPDIFASEEEPILDQGATSGLGSTPTPPTPSSAISEPAFPSPEPPRAIGDLETSFPTPSPPIEPAPTPLAETDDPLLRLLPKDEPVVSSSPAVEDDNLGDDLLPDFLKERKDDDGPNESSFIPELPSFLEADDAPSLEIVPFGTSTESGAPVQSDGEGADKPEPFIPELPDL